MTRDNDFMDIFEAAELLGVHVQTLRKLARRKGIPCFKVGRDWRFRKEALISWADEQNRVDEEESDGSILVIDDENNVRRAIAGTLRRLGFRVRSADDGERGLELVAEEAPDLILLDLMMPNMTGDEFLAELRETQPEIPVVIVTGFPKSNLMRKAMEYAPVMLLAKPIDRELLERTVRSVRCGALSSE